MSLLRNEVQFEYNIWTDERTLDLKLFTWGKVRMNEEEITLEDCTVDDIITLFVYEADEQKGDDHHHVEFRLYLQKNNLFK